jgi:hypothetical protein
MSPQIIKTQENLLPYFNGRNEAAGDNDPEQ